MKYKFPHHPLVSAVSLLFIIMVLPAFCSSALAQVQLERSVVATGGESSSGAGISISYTIGETAVTTLNGGGSVLTQGFQQPDALGVGFWESTGGMFSLTLFPNPAKDQFSIMIESPGISDMMMEIFDISGKTVLIREFMLSENTAAQTVSVNIGFLAPASYLVRISAKEIEFPQYFRLIKTM
jgi:hypothetical protein